MIKEMSPCQEGFRLLKKALKTEVIFAVLQPEYMGFSSLVKLKNRCMIDQKS